MQRVVYRVYEPLVLVLVARVRAACSVYVPRVARVQRVEQRESRAARVRARAAGNVYVLRVQRATCNVYACNVHV